MMSFRLLTVKLIKRTFPRLFFAARLSRVPLLGRLIDHALFEGDDLMFLPRERTLRLEASVDDPGQMVLPSQVVDHFIDQAGHLWIMDRCICRDSLSCRDYPVALGCLFLGEASLKIHPGLGRSATREEARAHVRKCRAAGLVHLIGRNKLDTVWLGVGPGRKLLTVCNCCPCCCLWRAIPHLDHRISDKVTRMPGVEVRVSDRCAACGTCTQGVCFVNAISLADGRAVIGDQCRGCGRCLEVCPEEAIEMIIDEGRVERAIEHITPLVELS